MKLDATDRKILFALDINAELNHISFALISMHWVIGSIKYM
jgi:hypothetical protein